MENNKLARLKIIEGENTGKEFFITGKTTIGRSKEQDIFLPSSRISRLHAILTPADKGVVLTDLKSRNGVFVNGKKISEAVLNPGDIIQIGPDKLQFLSGPNTGEVVRQVSGMTIVAGAKAMHTIIKASLEGNSADLFEAKGDDIESLKAALGKLKIICAVSEDIGAILDRNILLEKIMSISFEIFPVDRGFIMLKEDAGVLVPKIIRSKDSKSDKQEIMVSQTIINQVVEKRVSVLIADTSAVDSLALAKSIVQQKIRSAMCAPLICKNDFMGLIYVDSTEKAKAFSEDDLKLFTGVANQVAIALENAKLSEKIQAEAKIRGNLQRYLSAEIVEQVLNNKLELKLGGEIMETTVLFSDIRGFTALSEKMKPEDVVDLLNEYFDILVAVIFKYGGMLDKFIGDSIMAVWGVPAKKEDDELNAVRAAVDMQAQMFYLNSKRSAQGFELIGMGIGINTGSNLTGNIGSATRMDYTVIGDNVNLASRLEYSATPNQILIGEETYNRIAKSVVAEPLPLLKVKGKSKELKVYSVIGVLTPGSKTDEKRMQGRMKVSFPCGLIFSGENLPVEGMVSNFSEEGAEVFVDDVRVKEIVDGRKLNMKISILGTEKPVETDGTVKWSQAGGERKISSSSGEINLLSKIGIKFETPIVFPDVVKKYIL